MIHPTVLVPFRSSEYVRVYISCRIFVNLSAPYVETLHYAPGSSVSK
jgi:hypothetical protein